MPPRLADAAPLLPEKWVSTEPRGTVRKVEVGDFYNGVMRAVLLALTLATSLAVTLDGQTPRPIPQPGGSRPAQPPATAGTQAPSTPPASTPAAPAPAANAPAAAAPSAATLGLPVYPTAQFIASYDAGRGQRYYLFGTAAAYAEVVAFYRTQLKDKGDVIYEQPPTHMFQVGRFREEAMAFPPGITVKDWTWGGSQGYPNPKLGGEPARYPSIIMIVPAPPAAPPAR
jgi:hypothetical protein